MFESGTNPRFVSTVASPCSPPALDCRSTWTLDCRHGRVLIHLLVPTDDLVVFDPLTGEQQHLPLPADPNSPFTGAVLCAVAGCDHLNCHGGPFLVVFMGTDDVGTTWASVYSSETGAWGASSSIELDLRIQAWPSLLIGDSLYFMVSEGMSILRYNLAERGLSVMDIPDKEYEKMGRVLMLEDGKLGFVGVEDRSLHLWSWQEAGADGSAGWKRGRVIELATLLPIPDTTVSLLVVGSVEGKGVVFLTTDVAIFTLKIKSGRVAKVYEKGAYFDIIPYSSFYLPGG